MLRIARRYASRFVESCPPPVYDTGCTHCGIPEFPPDKKINFEHNLNSTGSDPWKHLLVFSHGFKDFNKMPAKVEFTAGSVASEMTSLKRLLSPNHPVSVTNALVEGINDKPNGKEKVYLYPDNKVVEFELKHAQQFVEHYLLPKEEEVVEVFNPFAPAVQKSKGRKDHSSLFTEKPIEEDLVLICGHTQRDIRCGLLAPLLEQEFEKVLEKEKLHHVRTGLISHVGGHAYAGNVLYFPRDCSKMPIVFYGRVFPDLVQGIVNTTIKDGKIIKELYRGDVHKK
ncbi:hypothetical protein FT663_03760 [Candidozyma haemuli var. vulneris]|uniref:Altered inheritance of mitochondria protein 32 n=1 Tax=Candidozyma haemuli TaxID=45357 RepID=A0A2V1ASY5_9ASCO|nr:hypothetical protein CXQ85_002191 [[Candida] haemuloni]KAF3989089.1 hypothetical protein FT663_03760 [[Candida] haemuloni var. vulneris]KAF3991198.1 hypothetical protein FT662_01873 [[Candida] haemuloni var. vulneris]PVH20403.1 hypothetical protein CXQ85_002191 [[Candida] haemuloni]